MRRKMTYPESQTYNPVRPPDWRWQRACDLVESGAYASTKRDDEWTCRAVRFLRALRRSDTQRHHRKLAMREPGIFLALRVSREGGLRPLEIEARVLARESDRAIARKVDLPVAAVEAYTSLLFSVRDRVDAKLYITFAVAGLDPVQPPSAETLMLLSAYHHGPLVVAPWRDYLRDPCAGRDLTTPRGREQAAIDLLVSAHQIRIDDEKGASRATAGPMALVKRAHLITQISPKSRRPKTVPTKFAENAAHMLNSLLPPVRETDAVSTSNSRQALQKTGSRPRKSQFA